MKIHAIFLRALIAATLCVSVSFVSAQGCSGYERELEEYFYNFQPGSTTPNIKQVEMVYARCAKPSPKMELIYHYLKAMDVWYADYLSDEAAYHDARYYYEKAAAYFAYLVDAPASDEYFVDLYFNRAESLQNQLGIDHIAIEPLPQSTNETYRTRGENNTGKPYEYEWQKYTPARVEGNNSTYRTRSMEATETDVASTLRKSEYRSGEYRSPSQDEMRAAQEIEGEMYGAVGSLSALNAYDYLRFQKEWEKQTARSASIVSTPSENAGITRGGANARVVAPASAVSYQGLICIYDQAVVRVKPGEVSTPVGLVRFGETVAFINNQQPVKQGGNQYLSVRLQNGQVGWMVSHALVADGKLAVVTSPAKGFLSTNPQAARDRNMIIFQAGELVVLEAVDGEFIRIVSRDAGKRAWVRGIAALSIDELDILIGNKMLEASRQNSISMRKAILQEVRNYPGFEQSELADDVMAILNDSYTMR